MRHYKFALAIFFLSALLLALAQSVSAEEILVSQQKITLHIFSEKELYVFETITYAAEGNKSFEGPVKAWIPGGAVNVSIEDIEGPIDFDLQGNNATFELAISPSNLTSIVIGYYLNVEPQGFERQFGFETINFYPVDAFSVFIISQLNINIAVSDNLMVVMPLQSSEQYYVSNIANKEALQAQKKISIKFTEIKAQTTPTGTSEPPTRPQDISPYTVVAVLLIVALAAVLVYFWIGKKKTPGDVSEYKAEYEALEATLREIEEDHRAGNLSKEEYKKLKGDYEARKDSVEKQLKKR